MALRGFSLDEHGQVVEVRPEDAMITLRLTDGMPLDREIKIVTERIRTEYPVGTVRNDHIHTLLDGIERLIIGKGPLAQ
jgi:hypothetical protein